MSLRSDRNQTKEAVVSGMYVQHVLVESSKELEVEIKSRMTSFSSSFWNTQTMSVANSVLTYNHLLQHRFVDMKTRRVDGGIRSKKRHKIHNQPIFSQYNSIIKQLHFGFTESIKSDLFILNNKAL